MTEFSTPTTTPSWRDSEPVIVHSIKWRDADPHEHLHIVRGDTLDEVLLHLRLVKVTIAAARARAQDAQPDEASACREIPSALHRGAEDPDTSPYCEVHDTPYFKNTSKDGKNRVWWSHRLSDGGGFCKYAPAKG
jgi:hypothetical protein